MTRLEAAEAAGVTLRQLQWWSKTGLVGGRFSDYTKFDVRHARIWGIIARRFGFLGRTLTRSVDIRRCVRNASQYSPGFLGVYKIHSTGMIGAKFLKDEHSVIRFSVDIPGSVMVLEI